MRLLIFTSLLLTLLPGSWAADENAARPLIDLKADEQSKLMPSSKQVTISRPQNGKGVVISIQPGNDGYPGVSLKPESGEVWDLSKYGHVEARVVNLGEKALSLALRVDNPGNWQDNPYNTENVHLEPGEARTITTIFGYAFGQKPGFRLKPEAVSGVLVFASKSSAAQSFRIDSLEAAGPRGETPAADPATIRLKPQEGYLLGEKVKVTAAQIVANGGGEALVSDAGDSLKIVFSKKEQFVRIKPPQGRWDLRDAHQIRVKVRNVGKIAGSPSIRADSDAGSTDQATTEQPLVPGASGDIVVSFIPKAPWTGIKNLDRAEGNGTEGTGTKFTSDAVSGVTLLSDVSTGSQSFEVTSIVAAAPPARLPDWLGKRPPVDGDWIQTFQEEFDEPAIDQRKWNVYAANYWDKLSHFSKDNVVLESGVVKLRYVKRTGRHNDDPKGKETPYSTGFLDTYGKWVQRYGYFEARMKLPRAPGLWPAMWLMPDRGESAGEQWKRASTSEGGMEFDIMEFLSRWGVHRFNIAFHWDGYDKGHKQTGSTTIYTATDKEGFITAGLLWLPGQAVIYCNGTVIGRWESARISNVPSDIMFTHVMGGWDNDDLDDSKLPDEFVIDYVRCWQRKDLQ